MAASAATAGLGAALGAVGSAATAAGALVLGGSAVTWAAGRAQNNRAVQAWGAKGGVLGAGLLAGGVAAQVIATTLVAAGALGAAGGVGVVGYGVVRRLRRPPAASGPVGEGRDPEA